MIIDLTEKEWIEVIKLVDNKSAGNFADNQNVYDNLKTKMLFQIGIQRGKKQ
jgi:hypothetical protein